MTPIAFNAIKKQYKQGRRKMKNFNEFLARGKAKWGLKFDASELDKRFIPYYENGQRIEVTWLDGFEDYGGYGARANGKKARFTVGVSTGWKPVFLQVYSSRSFGGQAILSSAIKSIRGL